MKKNKISIPIIYEHEFHSLTKGTPKRIIILLHGYMLDGQYILNKFKDSLPSDSLIIAPNGPFLVPQKKGEEYFPRFSWYFFDPNKKTFYINYEPAANFVINLLEKINTNNLPITIIGYSQGGYLAPKVAENHPLVDSVIGVSCIFRKSRFDLNDKVIYSQIHGDNDLVVSIEEALEEWESIKNSHKDNQFIKVPDSGHRIDSELLENIKILSHKLTSV